MHRWRSQITGASFALLVVALVARALWELLRPLLPGVVVLLVLLGVLRLAGGRYRHWQEPSAYHCDDLCRSVP